MTQIKAFPALRYSEQAGPLDKLVTPPYDIINHEQQQAYYEASPYNIIRLEHGQILPTDDEQENRYTRAAATFQTWRAEGILQQDENPALYLYIQEFTLEGQAYRRSGFISTLKAVGYDNGLVLPHEETMPTPKADRYRLLEACRANFSPIFGLYADQSRRCERLLNAQTEGQAPLSDIVDGNGIRHQLWRIDDAETIAAVVEELDHQKIYIADGHHRYETASRFAADMAAQGVTGCNYMMIHLVNLYDPGLVVLPTHRLVGNLDGFSAHGLLDALTDSGFAVFPIEDLDKLLATMERTAEQVAGFGIYMEDQLYFVAIDRDDPIIAAAQPGYSDAYQKLDVSIAQSLILEGLCGIGYEELAEESYLGYCREAKEAIGRVKAGEFQFALLMNPTRVEELLLVANSGEKMPQNSTYFYPKVIAGLVINPLGE